MKSGLDAKPLFLQVDMLSRWIHEIEKKSLNDDER